MINAIVTGSQKYGNPRPDSDIDVVLFVSSDLYENLWVEAFEQADDKWLCLFYCRDRVSFKLNTQREKAYILWIDGDIDIYCNMSEGDHAILGGLHKWIPDGNGGYESTLRNDRVDIIPVCDPNIWRIWLEGTEALTASGGPVERNDAMEFFTSLGMPRFDS